MKYLIHFTADKYQGEFLPTYRQRVIEASDNDTALNKFLSFYQIPPENTHFYTATALVAVSYKADRISPYIL